MLLLKKINKNNFNKTSQIKIWFQNRRAKDRKIIKQKRKTDSSSNSTDSYKTSIASQNELTNTRITTNAVPTDYLHQVYSGCWTNENSLYSKQINNTSSNYDAHENFSLYDGTSHRYNI